MWKLRDVITMVVLSIVSGGIYRIWDVLTGIVPIVWVPGNGLVNGLWWIAAGLVPYIVRRPGAALIAELVASSIELILGSNWGLAGMLSGLLQGVGAEIAFMMFAWRRYSSAIMMLSGALAGVGATLQWLFQYNGDHYSGSIIVLYSLFTLISGAVLGGLLPKWIGDALYRTGSLRNFEIAKSKN